MYNEEDYISKIFREKEHLMEEKPSRNAWHKLEEKLDKEKVRRSRQIYQYISVAAAVIAVVAMISAISLFKNGNALVADNDNNIATPKESTELALTKKGSDWRKEYAPETLVESPQDEETAIAEKTFTVTKPNNSTVSSKPIDTPLLKEKTETITSVSNTKEVPQASLEVPSSSTNIAEAENVNSTTRVSKSATNRPDKVAVEEGIAKAYPAMTDYIFSDGKPITNAPDVAMHTTRKRTIEDFHWLSGSWRSETENGLSYERWTKKKKNILEAKGFIIENNDTIVIETMQIKQIRNKVFYISNFGTDNTNTMFELIDYQAGVATFENNKSNSPTKIVITENADGSFTISFYEKVTEKLKQRNNIENARAFRTMKKVF